MRYIERKEKTQGVKKMDGQSPKLSITDVGGKTGNPEGGGFGEG